MPGNKIEDLEQQLGYVQYLGDLVDQMLDDADDTLFIKRTAKKEEVFQNPFEFIIDQYLAHISTK